MCVTGQYHKGDTKSTPTADADRRRTKRHETSRITLVASLARASAVRSRRRTTGWIRSGGPADRDHGHAAMAWSDGWSGNCPGEPTHRRHASPPAHSTRLGRTPERQPRWRPRKGNRACLTKEITMFALNKHAAAIALGLAIAAVASPSLAQRSETPMNSAREQALRECSGQAGKMSQSTWGDHQIHAFRSCMHQHGQPE